ncbi:dihydrofolate reductase family protein [Streptacidiphilus jiangxiensis]|uniref:Dihydrofolate reductase n=1 Tax=Streptacidiphilus jiangxiensis TaxID=235985 RepID=A0A1H7HM96_STRJI|nr:dihydrofolate reductase family protein [Streptacidiphilus jiangxiensis]SEK50572.1 Dihydrofolate reductase [Streptacidiphilus jiangxiensis]
MARLVYSAITSLDGYVEDVEGRIAWSAPDDEVHAYINDLERPIGTYLYGRRMYETMAPWEDVFADGDLPGLTQEFATIWRAAEKVVYSRTLYEAATVGTRIEREFDPEAVRALKEAAKRDLSIGGAELAGVALKAGLVDECHLFLQPIVLGGGKRALPEGFRARLELVAERRFRSGVVHLHYRLGS